MSHNKTVERILDTAEQLFAEKGFAETSLRSITSQAGVNLAAVNYHFGSKKELIQALFSRFLDPFFVLLAESLDEIENDPEKPRDLESMLTLLADTVLRVESRSANDLSVFMRLSGVAWAQSQGHLRHYLTETYSGVFNRYMILLRESVPDLTAADLYWRVNFMMGTLTFTMASFDALQAISERDFCEKATVPVILHRMVPFLAAGMRH